MISIRMRGGLGRILKVGFGIMAMVILAGISPAFGQKGSDDRDNPTELTWSNDSVKVTGDLDGSETEQYYSLAVKPGKLTFTFDVKAAGTNAGAYFDVFGKNAEGLLNNIVVQGIDKGSDRVVKTLQINGSQTIIIRAKGIRYGDSGETGTFAFKVQQTMTRGKRGTGTHAHFVRSR